MFFNKEINLFFRKHVHYVLYQIYDPNDFAVSNHRKSVYLINPHEGGCFIYG